MDVSFRHLRELTPAEIDAWRVQRATDTRYDNPFLAPGVAQAVGAVRSDARVVMMRGRSGAVELVLPVQVSRSGLARPLGAPMCDENGPIATRDAAEMLTRVLAKAGIAAYTFSGWPEACASRGVRLRMRGLGGGGPARRIRGLAGSATRSQSEALQEDAAPGAAGGEGFRRGVCDVRTGVGGRSRRADRLEARTVQAHAPP